MEDAQLTQNLKTEFMRKSRFERIRNKFSEVSEEANQVITSANSDDILMLSVTYSNPKVIKAEIYDETKFVNLAF